MDVGVTGERMAAYLRDHHDKVVGRRSRESGHELVVDAAR
jgi:hypothetical protein